MFLYDVDGSQGPEPQAPSAWVRIHPPSVGLCLLLLTSLIQHYALGYRVVTMSHRAGPAVLREATHFLMDVRPVRDFHQFVSYAIKSCITLHPRHYHLAGAGINPAEELLLRIAYEVQRGFITKRDTDKHAFNAVFSAAAEGGHHVKKHQLRACIAKRYRAYLASAFPWFYDFLFP